uniref:Uncharacterized protein n=1 Tax=Kalanchoe fedtschenkoi TaxID=63787 RepID=A0A7N0USG6_KALFE
MEAIRSFANGGSLSLLLRPPPTSSFKSRSLPFSCNLTPQDNKSLSSSPQISLPSVGEAVVRASLLAILSTSLFLVDPALAYKGGGPYGAGVTRGQDLSGKDFSGKTLIKQDFKTSILRQANFKGAKLIGASFFDADLTGLSLRLSLLRK